jgi:hypothetical protein
MPTVGRFSVIDRVAGQQFSLAETPRFQKLKTIDPDANASAEI